MTDDPRRRFLSALKHELCAGPLTRRRVVREIAAHLDDIVAELEASGRTERAALDEALDRIGGVDVIAAAFRELRPDGRRWSRLRSPAWIAVAAMSLVTVWAADLPQASGAKATTRALDGTRVVRLGQRWYSEQHPQRGEHARPAIRLSVVRASRPGRR